HHQEGEVGESLGEQALAGLPFALDELDHRHAETSSQGAKHQAEGRGRLSLALPGVDEQQPLAWCLVRHAGLSGRPALAGSALVERMLRWAACGARSAMVAATS